MPTTRAKRGPYEKHDTARCVWCDEPFETNHGNAQTCGQRCRSRLKKFRDLTGLEPERPPGNVTAMWAYRELVTRLLAAERRRRVNVTLLANTSFHKRDALEREFDAAEPGHRRRDG